jgi:hypothetical protein
MEECPRMIHVFFLEPSSVEVRVEECSDRGVGEAACKHAATLVKREQGPVEFKGVPTKHLKIPYAVGRGFHGRYFGVTMVRKKKKAAWLFLDPPSTKKNGCVPQKNIV